MKSTVTGFINADGTAILSPEQVHKAALYQRTSSQRVYCPTCEDVLLTATPYGLTCIQCGYLQGLHSEVANGKRLGCLETSLAAVDPIRITYG